MKTSIATVSISGDLREKLDAIAGAGFDGVEIFENDFLTHDGTPAEVGKLIRERGLTITALQPFRDFEGLPEPQRAQAFARAERKFAVMGELGAELMLICSNTSPAALGGIDRAAADFHELGTRAARHGIRVGFEALSWGRHVFDHRDAWEIVRRADHKNIGLVLDSFHTLARRIDPETIRAIPGDRIFLVQLSDAPWLESDFIQWSRHFRNMPGQGDLGLQDFMRAVAATGYQGPLSIEVFNDHFRGASARTICVDGRRSLINLMDGVKRREPALKFDVPDMPDRVNVKGVEFVEFAAGEGDALALGDMLASMGFARGGEHINKDVVLYRQGRINIVVNTEKDGLALASYLTHGTCAYAIGLRVENAAETVARAKALGAELFTQRHGPGELEIPAVRGLGGGLIYFLDDAMLPLVWQQEFRSVDAGAAAGLMEFDHVAQTMRYEEMLTWILFYTSIFRTAKLPMVDVVDPTGLIRSQVIENDNKSLRLTLNGAESQRTLAGRFIAESFGSGIQHIAFASDDIFATAAALQARGFAALKVGQNYYSDLAAQFGLEDEYCRRLQGLNLLYDRDEAGEFFQLYGRAQENGIFFEIVERRGGYRGYGARNAPFRIAAQRSALPEEGLAAL